MKYLWALVFMVCCSFAQSQEITSSPVGTEAKGSIYIKMGEAQTKKSLLAFPAPQYSGTPSQSRPQIYRLGTVQHRSN